MVKHFPWMFIPRNSYQDLYPASKIYLNILLDRCIQVFFNCFIIDQYLESKLKQLKTMILHVSLQIHICILCILYLCIVDFNWYRSSKRPSKVATCQFTVLVEHENPLFSTDNIKVNISYVIIIEIHF